MAGTSCSYASTRATKPKQWITKCIRSTGPCAHFPGGLERIPLWFTAVIPPALASGASVSGAKNLGLGVRPVTSLRVTGPYNDLEPALDAHKGPRCEFRDVLIRVPRSTVQSRLFQDCEKTVFAIPATARIPCNPS